MSRMNESCHTYEYESCCQANTWQQCVYHTHTHTYVCIYSHTHIHIRIYTYIFLHIYKLKGARVYSYTYIYARVYSYTYMCIFLHIYKLKGATNLKAHAEVNIVLESHRAIVEAREDLLGRQLASGSRHRKASHGASFELGVAFRAR